MSDVNLTEEVIVYPNLDTVPVEVFLYICTFLDGKELVRSLKFVCKRFHEILSDDSAWRTWLNHRWPDFPSSHLCYKDDEVASSQLCLHIDRAFTLWSKEDSQFTKWCNQNAHISTVDAVKLIQDGRIAISGSRDRTLAVWNTEDGLSLLETTGAHSGWIWSLAYCSQTRELYSCSWDAHVKLWSLDERLTEVAAFKCKTAVLAGVCRPGLVAAGMFAPEVDVFDPRRGSEQVATYRAHSRSIMALAIVRDFIVSASEDQTLSVWDLTAGKVFKSGIRLSTEPSWGHPMTLSFSQGNLLFVGGTDGRLYIFDTLHGSFELMESFDLGHQPLKNTITAMWHDPGFMLTGSKDSTVRVHTTTRPPTLITHLTSQHGEITAMDFSDPVLFVGCANSAVEMWKP